jgi:hypothetical protein
MMHNEVGKRRVEDGRGVELLARDGGPDDGEDAGTNDRTNSQGGQRPGSEGLLQPMFWLF